MNINKIYYCCPVQGDRRNIENCRYTVEFLQKLGLQVLTSYIVDNNVNESFTKDIGGEELNNLVIRAKSVEKLYRAQGLIADISAGSTGVGMEIELARHRHYVIGGKPMPILLLYYEPLEKLATCMATGMVGDGYVYVTIVAYNYRNEIDSNILAWLKKYKFLSKNS